MASERDFLDNDPRVNILEDRNLDIRVETNLDTVLHDALVKVVDAEYGGQKAPYIRALIVRDLRQRYLIY